MITVDQNRLNQDIARFNQTATRWITDLGAAPTVIILHEAAKLDQTLINITPKAKAAKIEEDVRTRFQVWQGVGSSARWSNVGTGGKHGSGDVRWYAWGSNALYGVAQTQDMTKASPEEIAQAYYKSTPKGKLRVGKRGKQTVYLWRRILTTPEQAAALIKRIKDHIGRLKAGWLPAWFRLGEPFQVPSYVEKHSAEARGYAIDATNDPVRPSFTMANQATGVGRLKRERDYLFGRAIKIRCKAMLENMRLVASGKKKLPEVKQIMQQSAEIDAVYSRDD